VLIDGIIKVTP